MKFSFKRHFMPPKYRNVIFYILRNFVLLKNGNNDTNASNDNNDNNGDSDSDTNGNSNSNHFIEVSNLLAEPRDTNQINHNQINSKAFIYYYYYYYYYYLFFFLGGGGGRRGKPEYPEKNLPESLNWTRATSVEGERSHHCAIPSICKTDSFTTSTVIMPR